MTAGIGPLLVCTVICAPGNTAADNGTAPLWSRNNASGFLYHYPNTTDPATGIITLQPRTQIGTGYTAADYPLIFSVGDINPDADGNGAPPSALNKAT